MDEKVKWEVVTITKVNQYIWYTYRMCPPLPGKSLLPKNRKQPI